MIMTTPRLVFLRIYNITIGRCSLFSKVLRLFLLRLLVHGKKEKYVASSRYFEYGEMK